MAKFIPILGQLSGTIAGLVFSHNRNGAYVRQRALPINPLTNMQTRIRSVFSFYANRWAVRTDPEKDAWRAYALTMPLIDSLGQSYNMSGFNAYVRGNAFRQYNNVSGITAGPVQGGQAAALAPVPGVIVLTDSASGTPNSIELNVAGIPGFDRATTGTLLQVSLGPQLPAGVDFFSTPFQVKGTVLGNTGAPPATASIPAGLSLVVGQRLPVGLRWSDEEARVSPKYQEIITVTNVP